jgi:hypothetical protein
MKKYDIHIFCILFSSLISYFCIKSTTIKDYNIISKCLEYLPGDSRTLNRLVKHTGLTPTIADHIGKEFTSYMCNNTNMSLHIDLKKKGLRHNDWTYYLDIDSLFPDPRDAHYIKNIMRTFFTHTVLYPKASGELCLDTCKHIREHIIKTYLKTHILFIKYIKDIYPHRCPYNDTNIPSYGYMKHHLSPSYVHYTSLSIIRELQRIQEQIRNTQLLSSVDKSLINHIISYQDRLIPQLDAIYARYIHYSNRYNASCMHITQCSTSLFISGSLSLFVLLVGQHYYKEATILLSLLTCTCCCGASNLSLCVILPALFECIRECDRSSQARVTEQSVYAIKQELYKTARICAEKNNIPRHTHIHN